MIKEGGKVDKMRGIKRRRGEEKRFEEHRKMREDEGLAERSQEKRNKGVRGGFKR